MPGYNHSWRHNLRYFFLVKFSFSKHTTSGSPKKKLPVLRRLLQRKHLKNSSKVFLTTSGSPKKILFRFYEGFLLVYLKKKSEILSLKNLSNWFYTTFGWAKISFRFYEGFSCFFQWKHLKNSSKVFLTTSGSPK